MKRFKLPMSIPDSEFSQFIHVVSTHVLYCPLAKSWECTQQDTSSFGQIFRAEAAHLLLAESTIVLSIISLQVLRRMSRFRNSSKSSTIVPRLVNSSALLLPGISLCPGSHTIWISYRSAILLRYLRQPYTVLEFITLETKQNTKKSIY